MFGSDTSTPCASKPAAVRRATTWPTPQPASSTRAPRGAGRNASVNFEDERAVHGEPRRFFSAHWAHEPTPNPSQEGNGRDAEVRLLPSWEGPGVGRFMRSMSGRGGGLRSGPDRGRLFPQA